MIVSTLQHILRFWLVFIISLNMIAGQMLPHTFSAARDACETRCPCDEDAEGSHDGEAHAEEGHAHHEEAVADASADRLDHHTSPELERETAHSECPSDCPDCDRDISQLLGILSTTTVAFSGHCVEYRSGPHATTRCEAPSFEIFIPPRHPIA